MTFDLAPRPDSASFSQPGNLTESGSETNSDRYAVVAKISFVMTEGRWGCKEASSQFAQFAQSSLTSMG